MLNIKHLIASFSFAISGINFAIRHERNMRIHLVVGFYVLYLQHFYNLEPESKALLFLTVGFVIVAELFNTAIEKTVNLVTPSYHNLAKISKDVAAGGVLVCAIVSIGVAVCLLGDINVIYKIILYFCANWLRLALLLLSFGASLWFIFVFGEPQESLPNN